MTIKDPTLYRTLEKEIDDFSNTQIELSILSNQSVKDTFIRQLIDSVRRVNYALKLAERNPSPDVSTPTSEAFNPLKAAVHYNKAGDTDEAAWLVFLATHFGYSPTSKWLLTKDIYGNLGEKPYWTWRTVSTNLAAFSAWAQNLQVRINQLSPRRKFGNHRKYESLKDGIKRSLSNTISSYVTLVLAQGSHKNLFSMAAQEGEHCKYKAFDELYNHLSSVTSFGRTARFDLLSMLGKLNIADMEPPKTYMQGSTGPAAGAKLLLGLNKNNHQLEDDLFRLKSNLSIDPFGMQVLEDALCNWQKHPEEYRHFGG